MQTTNLDINMDNLGGLQCIIAIPPSSLNYLKKNGLQYNIDLINEDDIIELFHLSDDTYVFTEDHQLTDAGDLYTISIEGILPKISPELVDKISILENGEWYVVAIDNNGYNHFCGSDDTLMKFSSKKETAKRAGDLNKIDFNFTVMQTKPSIFLCNFQL